MVKIRRGEFGCENSILEVIKGLASIFMPFSLTSASSLNALIFRALIAHFKISKLFENNQNNFILKCPKFRIWLKKKCWDGARTSPIISSSVEF